MQWVVSAKAIQKANENTVRDLALNPGSLMFINQKGATRLDIPNKARYFRLVVWTSYKKKPDLLTNWVNIVANKIYVVNQNQLITKALAAGSGC